MCVYTFKYVYVNMFILCIHTRIYIVKEISKWTVVCKNNKVIETIKLISTVLLPSHLKRKSRTTVKETYIWDFNLKT